MNFLKAFLLTIFLTVVYYIPQSILVLLYKHSNLNVNLFNPNFELVWSLSSIIAYFLVFHFFWKPKPDYSTILEIKGLNLDLIPYLILVVIGYGFVGQPFWDCNRLIEYYQNSNIEPYTGGLRKLNLQYAYSLIRALVIAPILEEVFFRKFLFLKLLEKYKLFVAIIISSICFSAIHFETPNNLIPSLIFGVISCLIFFKTKNISYSILLHFLNNLCITLFNMFGESYFNWLDNLKFNFVYWTLFVLGILTIILGMKKITTTNKVKK